MKFIFYILLTAILISFLGCQRSNPEIHFINLYTTTITLVQCENLKKSPSTRKIVLTDRENDILADLFSHLQPVQRNPDIDARMYGFVYRRTEKLDFCLSVTIVEINDRKFLVSPELRDYLVKLTKSK